MDKPTERPPRQSPPPQHPPGPLAPGRGPEPPTPPLPVWQGPELAMAQIQDAFERVKGALQPVRPDIISHAADEGRRALELLERAWHSAPPGFDDPVWKHKRQQ